MGQLVIHDLDDAVIDALHQQAAATGVSVEDMARLLLAEAISAEPLRVLARLDEVRGKIGPQTPPTIVELLRGDRRRDGP